MPDAPRRIDIQLHTTAPIEEGQSKFALMYANAALADAGDRTFLHESLDVAWQNIQQLAEQRSSDDEFTIGDVNLHGDFVLPPSDRASM
jgi:hypothetical protein